MTNILYFWIVVKRLFYIVILFYLVGCGASQPDQQTDHEGPYSMVQLIVFEPEEKDDLTLYSISSDQNLINIVEKSTTSDTIIESALCLLDKEPNLENVDFIKKHLSVEIMENTSFIEVRYYNENGEYAIEVLKALVGSLNDYIMRIQRNCIERHITKIDKEVDSIVLLLHEQENETSPLAKGDYQILTSMYQELIDLENRIVIARRMHQTVSMNEGKQQIHWDELKGEWDPYLKESLAKIRQLLSETNQICNDPGDESCLAKKKELNQMIGMVEDYLKNYLEALKQNRNELMKRIQEVQTNYSLQRDEIDNAEDLQKSYISAREKKTELLIKIAGLLPLVKQVDHIRYFED